MIKKKIILCGRFVRRGMVALVCGLCMLLPTVVSAQTNPETGFVKIRYQTAHYLGEISPGSAGVHLSANPVRLYALGGSRYLLAAGYDEQTEIGRYFFHACTSAATGSGNVYMADDSDEVRTVRAVLRNGSLYILLNHDVPATDVATLEGLVTAGTILKINVGSPNNFVFAFTQANTLYPEAGLPDNALLIDSEMGGRMKISEVNAKASVSNSILAATSTFIIEPAETTPSGNDITAAFTDANFKAAVYQKIGKTAPAPILDTDVSGIIELDVANKNIASLAGIRYFTALQELVCYLNQLVDLDVSECTNLQILHCEFNQLSTLNISGLMNLDTIYCTDNQLSTLDVSGFTNLQGLHCEFNQLTTLDVSGLTNLQSLACSNNQLSTLDVSGLTNLQWLACSNNQLSTLNLSGLTNLRWLNCSDNQLTTLIVSGLTNLQELYCGNNQLTTLNVSGLTNLQALNCGSNQLTTLDLTGTGLTTASSVYCSYNNMLSTANVIGWIGGASWTFDPQNPVLTLSASTLYVEAPGGQNNVTVSANTTWTASSDATWLTVSPASGTNSGTLTLTAAENTATASRTATVTVTGGGITRTIAVTQAAATVASYRTAPLGYVKIYRSPAVGVDGSLDLLAANVSEILGTGLPGMNFLSVINTASYPNMDGRLYVDLAYGGAGRPQYLLWAPGHETTAGGHIRGQFLINATDSARAGGAGTAITNPDYVWDSAFDRLAFVNGIHAGNALYVTGGVSVTDDNVAALDALAQAGSIRKINLSDGTQKNSVFSFRQIEGSDNFLIESVWDGLSGAWVRIRNGVPIISYGSFFDAVLQAEHFNVTAAPAPAPALTLSTSTLSFTDNGGSSPVAVTATVGWTAGSSATWLTVAPTSGTNSGTLTLTATANTATAPRTATVTVTGGGITRTVAVTQAAAGAPAPALSVSPAALNVAAAGGPATVTVTSNVGWTTGVSSSWLTVSPSSGTNNGVITVTVAANTTTGVRTGDIAVYNGAVSDTIRITQAAAPALTVSADTLSFEAAGGTQSVSVSSNTEWTADSDATWITVAPASGANNGTLTVTAAANPGYARADTVSVFAGGFVRKILVTQAAAQQIVVEPEPPVDNRGTIEVALEIPVNELFSITFTLRLPAGFILDQNATSLVSGLLSGYRLSITPTESGGWRFEITPQTALRNGDETVYQKVVNIVYTIAPESVPAGDYAVKLTDVNLQMNSGETVHRDEITVPVHVTSTGNAAVDATAVSYANGLLTVNTPVAEQITVYSVSGARIYSAPKEAGKATFDLSRLAKGVYIVTGNAWTRKIINNK